MMLELLLRFCDCLQRWDGSCPSAKVLEDGGRVGRVLAMENGQCVGPRSPISGVAEKGGAGALQGVVGGVRFSRLWAQGPSCPEAGRWLCNGLGQKAG